MADIRLDGETMKPKFGILSVMILLAVSCTASATPALDNPAAESRVSPPFPARSTDPPPQPPTATWTPRPTVGLDHVLTPEITVEYDVKYIILRTSDDVQLSAKRFGDGELVVILAHQGTIGANQRDWEPFARSLAQRGLAAATLDFRGFGRSTGDMIATNFLIRDMRALVDYLTGEGYQRFVCMGASMGGSTCLRAAVDYGMEGVVVIGSTMNLQTPTTTLPAELAALTIPKLFITTENDRYPQIPDAIRNMYNISQEPKWLRVFPGEAHGTEMFNRPYGEDFTAELMAFVEMLR